MKKFDQQAELKKTLPDPWKPPSEEKLLSLLGLSPVFALPGFHLMYLVAVRAIKNTLETEIEKYQQRNRRYKKEPNGNFGTQK